MKKDKNIAKQIDLLIKNGIIIPESSSVFIAPEVALEKIAPGTVIHPFCRIYGSQTSIGKGCVLGAEAPVTLDNCQLGAEVKLNGGYFSGATFLDGSSLGSCAHVRPGTLIEEHSGGAHAVGLKQTVLFPYVLLGSLINFCDCLMAGGSSRKNHSEVGSSYIHFNYTPHQDKATSSLIGDVPRGVLLNQPPVFLGGQGGLVGPARIAFGVIAPAGVILRKDVLTAGLAGNAAPTPAPDKQFIPGAYRAINRIIANNLIYIGNICALRMWYRCIRAEFMGGDQFQAACLAGALERLEDILKERVNRLGELAGKMPHSIELNMSAGGHDEKTYLQQQKSFASHWPEMLEKISQHAQYEGNLAQRNILLAELSITRGRRSYLETVASLNAKAQASAIGWLQSIVDRMAGIWKTELKNGVF